jgi:hypothetical protein
MIFIGSNRELAWRIPAIGMHIIYSQFQSPRLQHVRRPGPCNECQKQWHGCPGLDLYTRNSDSKRSWWPIESLYTVCSTARANAPVHSLNRNRILPTRLGLIACPIASLNCSNGYTCSTTAESAPSTTNAPSFWYRSVTSDSGTERIHRENQKPWS